MKFYNNKTAYITGGSSGIGLSIARILSSYGTNVVIFARNKEKLKRALAEIEKKKKTLSQRFAFVEMDVSDAQGVKKKIDRTVREFGIPDIVINSAGITCCSRFEQIPFEKFDELMKIDLYGIWNMLQAVIPHMKENGGGNIVNISSMAGIIGVFGYTAYSAAKFGIIGLSECLRGELKGHNINVSVLCPPDTDTPQLAEENKTKPDETRAIAGNAGLYQPDYVAGKLLKNLVKKKFIIIPGMESKFIYFVKRLFPGIPEFIMDGSIKKVSKKSK